MILFMAKRMIYVFMFCSLEPLNQKFAYKISTWARHCALVLQLQKGTCMPTPDLNRLGALEVVYWNIHISSCQRTI